jgi:hypothetical protein
VVTADRLIRAIGLVDRLGGLDDPAGFADLVLPALAELVGGDVLTCAEVDLATGALCRAGFPDGVIPPARHRLAITLVEPGQAVVCLAVHRSRPGFTAADRELLDVLRGPLLTGLSRARARAGRPVGNARLGELTDGEMRVLDLTALGRTNDAIAGGQPGRRRGQVHHDRPLYGRHDRAGVAVTRRDAGRDAVDGHGPAARADDRRPLETADWDRGMTIADPDGYRLVSCRSSCQTANCDSRPAPGQDNLGANICSDVHVLLEGKPGGRGTRPRT